MTDSPAEQETFKSAVRTVCFQCTMLSLDDTPVVLGPCDNCVVRTIAQSYLKANESKEEDNHG